MKTQPSCALCGLADAAHINTDHDFIGWQHCDNGLQCIAAGEQRSCICLCHGCKTAGRAALKDGK